MEKSIPKYEVRRVGGFKIREQCADQHAAVSIAKRELEGLDREHVLAIYLNGQNSVTGYETIGIGVDKGTTVSMTTVFRGALIAGACGVILAHNHPGGSLKASDEDFALLLATREIGKVIGCALVDFLIVSDHGHIGIETLQLEMP